MADHTHDMAFDSENAEQVIFRCSKCKRSVGFWKPETNREPQAKNVGKGKWEAPDGPIGRTLGHLCDNGK